MEAHGAIHFADANKRTNKDQLYVEFGLHGENRKKQIDIVMIGKYIDLVDSYKSLNEAVFHAGVFNDKIVNVNYIDSETITKKNIKLLSKMNGIIVPGGFGNRGIEGKILSSKISIFSVT